MVSLVRNVFGKSFANAQWLAAFGGAMLAANGAVAADKSLAAYPDKAIRLIVPFPPGGGTDLVSRLLQPALTAALGQQILIDNRGGAQGATGTAIGAKAEPDGYTLIVAEIGAVTIAPWIYDQVSFDVRRDFAPITMLIEQPYIVSVHPSVAARTLAEYIKLAQAKTNGFNFGSGNVTSHLAQEVFYQTAKAKLTHVPYRGSGPAMTALLSGEVQTLFSGPGAAIPQIRAGKIRALAVTTLKRSRELPELATLDEQGYKGFSISGWYGLMAPAATPRPIITRWNTLLTKILSGGDTAKQLSDRGYEPTPMTPEAFGKFMAAELERWGKAVKAAGVQATD
jgi:tripartite-type tricarboxylate transporter receptor subunit TctC